MVKFPQAVVKISYSQTHTEPKNSGGVHSYNRWRHKNCK